MKNWRFSRRVSCRWEGSFLPFVDRLKEVRSPFFPEFSMLVSALLLSSCLE